MRILTPIRVQTLSGCGADAPSLHDAHRPWVEGDRGRRANRSIASQVFRSHCDVASPSYPHFLTRRWAASEEAHAGMTASLAGRIDGCGLRDRFPAVRAAAAEGGREEEGMLVKASPAA